MTTDPHVLRSSPTQPLPPHHLDDAVTVLAASFADEPNFLDLFPDPRVRARALPRLFAALCRDAADHGRIDAAWHRHRLVGVSVWLAPGAFPLDGRRQVRLAPTMARLLLAAPRSAPRLARCNRAVSALHPPQPYAYLAAIGIDPSHQRQGLGDQLLTTGLAAADTDGVPCYLEAQRSTTVGWYQRHGFEVQVETTLLPGGSTNWTMLRRVGAS